MRITKRQLRRIIREESKGSTKKYDDDSALQGDQSELPDALQKGIIDKTVEDREEEKNESFRITKRQLRMIIKEEKLKLLREGQAQEEALFHALDQYVMVLDEEMGYDVPQKELRAEVLNFVDGYFEMSGRLWPGEGQE